MFVIIFKQYIDKDLVIKFKIGLKLGTLGGAK